VPDCDREAADWHALENARPISVGRTPPFVDWQIAAIAVVNDMVPATSNAGDSESFQGLQVQDRV